VTSTAARVLRVAAPARDDLRGVLEWSETVFGEEARARYEELITRAISMLLADPLSPGVHARLELLTHAHFFHLKSVAQRTVRQPRHVLYFTFDESTLVLLRVLHERQDPQA
jgi:toxin ParE1/3/4